MVLLLVSHPLKGLGGTMDSIDSKAEVGAFEVFLKSPASDEEETLYPVVIWFNGFQTPYSQYTELLDEVVSNGFITVSYTVPLLMSASSELSTRVDPLLRWITDGSVDAVLPQNVRANSSSVFTAGHSRGGKIASLAFTTNPDIVKATVLIDPVDSSMYSPITASNPSAVEALRASGQTASIIGAGVVGPCNPPEGNYRKFYDAVAAGSWKMVIEEAGHAQFVPGGSLMQDSLCGSGKASRQEVSRLVSSDIVAWFSTDAATKNTFVEDMSSRPGVDFQVKAADRQEVLRRTATSGVN